MTLMKRVSGDNDDGADDYDSDPNIEEEEDEDVVSTSPMILKVMYMIMIYFITIHLAGEDHPRPNLHGIVFSCHRVNTNIKISLRAISIRHCTALRNHDRIR